jgi:hypothetical protein
MFAFLELQIGVARRLINVSKIADLPTLKTKMSFGNVVARGEQKNR